MTRRTRLRTTHPLTVIATLMFAALLAAPGLAETENEKIGFSPNHVFEGAIKGENVDIMNGNVNLNIPLGPRMQLNDWFGYQLRMYYNSKIWMNEPADESCSTCQNCGDGNLTQEEQCDDGNTVDGDGCSSTCTAEYPGFLTHSDSYGAGVLLHFGRIYQLPDDNDYIYHYETSSGGDHTFCHDSSSNCWLENMTLDTSSAEITWNPDFEHDCDGTWTALPGDGTRIYFDHCFQSYDPKDDRAAGGWYATRVETIAEQSAGVPQQWFEIHYSTSAPDRIDYITDSANRTISFVNTGSDETTISFPPLDEVPSNTPDYVLVFGNEDVYDAGGELNVFQTHNIRLLKEIRLPELNETSERYTFDYGVPETLRFGYLMSWTVPTGASMDYHYLHYRTSPNAPFHSEIVAKVLRPDPATTEERTWTYSRFGNGVPKTLEEALEMTEGKTFQGSNPHKVKVLDPFGNLTIYRFRYTLYNSGAGGGDPDCNPDCPNQWDDGMLQSIDTFVGPVEDPTKLVRSESYDYTYENHAVQFRPGWSTTVNLTFVHVRKNDTTVVTHGGFEYPTTTLLRKSTNWSHLNEQGNPISGEIPKAREVQEYQNGSLYRTTHTAYTPTTEFHNAHDYIEVRDASDAPVSRTDTQWVINRPSCTLQRMDPNDNSSWTCDMPTNGSILIDYEYDAVTGSLSSKTTKGGDLQQSHVADYTFVGGTLESKTYGSLPWNAVDRDVDPNTGLVLTSRDPSYVATDYQWDKLGRLTQINPGGIDEPREANVDINYTSVKETHVTQTSSDTTGNSGFTESVYRYDGLGRLVEEQRRNDVDTYDFRKTEYDIEGRILRQSAWAAPDTLYDDLVWTVYEYDSPFLNPDAAAGESPYYQDPLGRVSRVIRPDGTTTETYYEGLATSVTVYEIAGMSGLIDSTTVYLNDAFGRLIWVDSPGNGADAQYLYDERDRLTEVQLIDPNPQQGQDPVQIRRFIYDPLGRLRTATNPENGTVNYLEYDDRGKLLRFQDARGMELKSDYDDAGRLNTQQVLTEGVWQLLVDHDYDRAPGALGKLAESKSYRAEEPYALATTTEYFYTLLDGEPEDCSNPLLKSYGIRGLNKRLAYTLTTIEPWNHQLKTEHCYNSLGLESTIAYPHFDSDRSVVQMSYRNGLLQAVDDVDRSPDGPNNGGSSYVTDVQYWPNGSTKRIERGNLLADDINRDEQGRPLAIHIESDAWIDSVWGCHAPLGRPVPLGQPEDCDDVYTYDGAGNISQIGLNTYGYDELNRLVVANLYSTNDPILTQEMLYAYDAFGNMTDRVKVPSSGNNVAQLFAVNTATNRLMVQVRNYASTSYTYDASGNMLTEGDRGYLYDPLNRLTEVWQQWPLETQTLVAEYDYDASGYRVRSSTEEEESFFVRDAGGRLLTEFRRAAGEADPTINPPAWNKDYVYALGQTLTMLKNAKPQTPGKPWATDVTDTELTVNWDLVEDLDIRHYELMRSVNGDTPEKINSCPIGEVCSSWNAETDNFEQDVDPNNPLTTLTYTVTAVDYATNKSDPSPELVVRPFDDTAPPAPTLASGTSMDRSVNISWNPITEFDDLWGYIIERVGPWEAIGGDPIPPQGLTWEVIANIAAPTTSYFDFELTNGQSYRYRVRAVDTAGDISVLPATPQDGVDEMTLIPEDIMPPAQPLGVTAQPDLVPDTIIVRWQPVLDADLDVYKIKRSPGINSFTVSGSVTEVVDTSLSSDETYTYEVAAIDTSGNESAFSDPASATPRDGSIPIPSLTEVIYDPDTNGTVGSGTCDTTPEDDDIFRVRLEWHELTGPSSYAIYRADGSGDDFTKIGESTTCDGESPSICTYFDRTVTAPEYTYYVVAVQSGREGPADTPVTVVDLLDIPVREVLLYDGRDYYTTENKKARGVSVYWSRVPETDLAGYHVYRRCQWDSGTFGTQLRDLSCIHTWVRLTASPVDEELFVDWTPGDLKGDFTYAVRPVSFGGQEGPWSSAMPQAELEFEAGGLYPWCTHDPGYDIFNKHPVILADPYVPTVGSEKERIDAITKGTADPTGYPDKPIIIDMNDPISVGQVVCFSDVEEQSYDYGQVFYYGDICESVGYPEVSDQSNARSDYEWSCGPTGCTKRYVEYPETEFGLFAYVDWLPNQESDLAGYHIEMAGSTEGPWARVTTSPLAWWETHFDARVWTPAPSAETVYEWYGPECAVLRVIAVDENGLESLPSDPFEVAPVRECNGFFDCSFPYGSAEQSCSAATATLAAPTNLVANTTTLTSGDKATRLTWDQVNNAHAYRVYRNTLREYSHYYFYMTGEVLDSACSGGVCEFIEEGNDHSSSQGSLYCPFDDCSLYKLDAFYVTAIESAAPGEMPRESPRSNVVLWHVTNGYAWQLDDEPEVWDAIASTEPSPKSEPWCEAVEVALEHREADNGDMLASNLEESSSDAAFAPLLTLGQIQTDADPPYEILTMHVDHLGSTRVITDEEAEIVSRHDFLPFGEELVPMFTYNTKMFTGHERDEETGLDYMLARYYGANLGRFLSTDPAPESSRLRSPQTWNRYSYVLNNPLGYIDPTGEVVETVELKNEGQNKVEDPSATPGTALSDEDTETLGAKETSTSVLHAVNVEATVSEGDDPGNYEFKQEAATVAVVEGQGADSVNPNDSPEAGNTATTGNTLVMWDAPGMQISGTPRAGKTIEFSSAFKTYAVDKSTGEQSGPTLYWGVTIKQGPEGVTKNVSGPITPQQYEQVKQRAGGGQ